MQESQKLQKALQQRASAFYYNRGNEKLTKKDYPNAIADYKQALRLNPQDWEALTNLGTAYDALHDYAKSLDSYDRALVMNPNSAGLHYNRGCALMLQRHLQAAREAYNRALELDTKLVWAYGNRGHVLSCLGLHIEALHDYDQAFSLAPNDMNTAWMFLWAHLSPSMHKEEAINELRRIAQIDPEQYIASLCLGVEALLRADLAKARAHFEHAATIESDQWDPPFWMGVTMALQGNEEGGRRAIDSALTWKKAEGELLAHRCV